jgi:hypothetical protein
VSGRGRHFVLNCLFSFGALATAVDIARAQDTVHAGAPAWGTNVSLRQLYVLGGPPEYQIGRVSSTAVDKWNRIYVFDGKNFQMRAYDADGKFVRNIGRAGAGPGEYRQALGATIVDDSVLTLYDVGGLRLVSFQPDGSRAGTVQLRRAFALSSGQLRSDAAGRAYFFATFIIAADGRSAQSLRPASRQVIRVAKDGRFVDSMPLPRFPPLTEPGFNRFAPRGYIMGSPAGSIVHGYSDRYRFTISRFDGTTRVVEKAWNPVPIAGEERDQLSARYEDEARRDATHPAFSLPRTKPAYRDIFVDQDGRIWISVFARATKRSLSRDTTANSGTPLDWAQDPTFDVFDPAGRFLGTVVLPYGSTLWAARNDRIYARSIGPEGEERLIAYQLTGIAGR